MPQHTRQEVKDFLTKNTDEAVDILQMVLQEPFVCGDDCDECYCDVFCVDDGIVAEEVKSGSNEEVPDGKDSGTSQPDKHT